MHRSVFLLLFWGLGLFAGQGQLQYDYKGKNQLAIALTEVLNASNQNFARCKGGRLPALCTPTTDVFKSRLKLPDVKEAYLIVPKDSGSKPLLRFVLHKAPNKAEAEAAYLKDVQTLLATYKKKWMAYRDPVSEGGLLPNTKTLLCYQQPNGFVYSSAQVVARQMPDSNWAIHLDVLGGPATFYYFTPKNAPVISDLFVEGFRKNFDNRGGYDLQCMNNMPGFNCRVLSDSTGRQRLEYFKQFASIHEAQFEYDVALTNVRAALGVQYVHRRLHPRNGCYKANFVHAHQIAREQQSEVELAICPQPENGFELVVSLPKKSD